jgi:hypothetical protein
MTPIRLKALSDNAVDSGPDPLTLFALINLGVIESLANGSISPTDSIRLLYNADNCLHVNKTLKNRAANDVMGRGVQLADLFDGLPPDEAHRQFVHELSVMRALCVKLMERDRLVA